MSLLDKIPFPRTQKDFFENLFSTTDGHNHDGSNSRAVTVGTPAPDSVNNAALVDDVKVGSLAGLATAAASVTDAIDAVEVIAEAGVTDAATAQGDATTALGLANTALQGTTEITNLRMGRGITLSAANPTRVLFQAGAPAEVTGTLIETYDFSSGVQTLEVTPDGAAQEDFTFTAVEGTHAGSNGGLGDISGQADNRFNIAVDADVGVTSHEVEITLGNCDTGANTAAEMQTQIRALAGIYAAVDVVFAQEAAGPPQTGTYTITSGTTGQGSKVRITRAATYNVTEELQIGPTYGTDVDGSGVGQNSAEATAAEVAAFIMVTANNFVAAAVGDVVELTAQTANATGTLVVGDTNGATTLGLAHGTYYGAHGLGYATDMSNDEYLVTLTKTGAADVALDFAVDDVVEAGFSINTDPAADTSDVNVMVVGVAA